MKSKKTKRILSCVLTLAMVIAMLPTAVFAANESGVTTEADLKAAIETVTEGGTVTLGNNIELSAKLVIPADKTFTLDLGNYNITQTAEGVNAINLSSGDNVTITGTGTITGNNNGIYVPSGAELTVNGATIKTTANNGIYNEGIVTVNSGTITGGEFNGIYNIGVASVNNGEISGDIHGIYNGDSWEDEETGDKFVYKGVLTVNGGTFSSICTDNGSNSEATITNPNGIYNGFVSATNVTGGTFNDTLVMTGENPSVSGATINAGFSWWSSAVPTINAGVKFGNAATIVSNSTGKDIDKYRINASCDGIVLKTYISLAVKTTEGGNIRVSSDSFGTLSGTGLIVAKDVESNTKIIIKSATVTAEYGYIFDGWYLNDTKLTENIGVDGSLNNYEFTVDEATNLVAKFDSRNLESKAETLFKDYSTTTEYLISSIDDMELFAYAVNNLGKNFSGKTVTLGANLDFSGKTYCVIGNEITPFKGTFNGGGKIISNIKATKNTENQKSESFSGIFGITNGAEIISVNIENCEFAGEGYSYAGGIAAEATNSTIKNCNVTNVITSGWFSGAVIGHTYGGTKIENVTVAGCTASGTKAGNVAGYSEGIKMTNVSVSDVKEGAALIGHANAGTNVIEDVTVDAPNVALIDTTYSGTSANITIKGTSNIKVKNVVNDKVGENKSVDLEAGTITVSEPTTVAGGSTITIGNNAEITVDGGNAFAKLEEGAKVDKIDSGGKKTTVTVGAGGGSVDNNANLIIPAGSTVGDKTVGNDAVMTPNGTVIEGNGTNAPIVNDDGSITVPAGGKVTETDGTETTLNNGGSVTSSDNVDKVTPTPSPSFGGSSNTADNVVNKPEDKNTNTAASTTATIKGTAADGTITATVDDATADKIIEKAVENKSEKVIINAVTGTAGTRCEVSIPEKTVQTLAEKTEAGITIKADTAEVTFDKKAVDALAAQAGTTGMVKLIAEIVAQDENKLQVELKLITSRGTVSDFKGGNVSVTVKPNDKLAAKDIVCVHIDDNGACHMADGVKNADGTYSFNTGHFSSYVIMVRDEAEKIMAEQAAELTAALKLKARSAKTAKGSIKVTLAVTKGDIKAIEDLGYTVKYKFYRSKSKAKSYKAKIEGAGKTYINNSGKKGTKYYYKARVMVYDAQGKLIAKTELKQCRYACRVK